MEQDKTFKDIEDGVPLWRHDAEDPDSAAQAPIQLSFQMLPYPDGAIFAAALEIHDTPGRPRFAHRCAPASHPVMRAWLEAMRSSGKLKLRFFRHGWQHESERVLELQTSSLPAFDAAGPVASDRSLMAYAEAYRAALAKTGKPREAWNQILEGLRAPQAAAKEGGFPLGLTLAALALAAAALAWYFLLR